MSPSQFQFFFFLHVCLKSCIYVWCYDYFYISRSQLICSSFLSDKIRIIRLYLTINCSISLVIYHLVNRLYLDFIDIPMNFGCIYLGLNVLCCLCFWSDFDICFWFSEMGFLLSFWVCKGCRFADLLSISLFKLNYVLILALWLWIQLVDIGFKFGVLRKKKRIQF